MSMRGKKLARAGKLSDSTVKRGRSKVESFVIHNTTDKEVDWMKGSNVDGKLWKSENGRMGRIRGMRTTTGKSIDMFNHSVEKTESMREEVEMVRSFRKLEGKELLVAKNKIMMEKLMKMRKMV
jgi:hypothetical protein